MRARWIVMFALLALIVLMAGAPVFSALIAGRIAESHGCTLHEGYTNPCIVDGEDIGQTLSAMFLVGWLGLITLPAGLVALVVWAVVAVTMILAGRRRSPGAGG